VLALALSLSAFAGNMPTGITAPPPSPDPQATAQGDISTTVAGNMPTGVAGNMPTGVTATDPATEGWLSLLQSLLALF
jgi:hypothetical protein